METTQKSTCNIEKQFIWLLGLILIITASCTTGSGEEELVHYDDLEELEVQLVQEIGESDAFIPGNLRDLLLLSDGSLLVSDWASYTIELFDPDGNHVQTVATEGGGPGELSPFFLLSSGVDDLLLVASHTRLDLFERETDENHYRYLRSHMREGNRGRSIRIDGALTKTEYLARMPGLGGGIDEMRNDPRTFNLVPIAEIVENLKILQDSLHLLKSPLPVMVFGENSVSVIGMPPYQTEDRVKVMERGHYAIGVPDSSALYFYDSDHSQVNRLPIHVSSRSVTRGDIEFHLASISAEHHRLIRARIPDNKPPFLDFWLSNDHVWLHSDTGESGKELIHLNMDGEFIGKLYLSDLDDIRYFRDNRIYTLHRDPDSGHSIRIYEIVTT